MKTLMAPVLAACVLPFMTSSCIDFGRETLSYRHDVARDRLAVCLVYEDIHGTGGGASLSDEEIGQLDAAIETRSAYFFSNWILQYERSSLEEALEEALEEPAAADQRPEPARQAKVHAMKQALESVVVENGPFYLDDEGRLCGCQFLAIEPVSPLIAAVNQALNAYVAQATPEELIGDDLAPSEASAAVLRRAGAKGHEWLRLDGNRITIRFPMAYPDFTKTRDVILDQLSAAAQADEEDGNTVWTLLRPWLEAFRSGILPAYEDDCLVFTVGYPAEEVTEISFTVADTSHPNAIAYVRETYGIAEAIDLDPLKAAHLAGRSRTDTDN